MIALLSRLFIKNYRDYENPQVRQSYGTLCGSVGICLNILLFIGKYFAGTLSGSIAIVADSFNNLSDAGSSLITLLGFRLAGKKPDPDHPYGHGRIEYISGLVVSFLILLMGFELAKSSIEKILSPEPMQAGWLPAAILVASICVKVYMFLYNRALAKRFDSPALKAVAFDSLSDVAATATVLASALVTRFVSLPEWVRPDAWSGLLVSLFILYTGLKSIRETTAPLLGRRPDPAFISAVEQATLSFEGIGGVHDVIVHDYGPGRVFVSLHAEVSADADVREIHEVIDNAERYLSDRFRCNATIHMDPIITDDPETARLREQVETILRETDESFSLHDFRAIRGPQDKTLLFDVSVPYAFPGDDESLKRRIEDSIAEQISGCRADVTIDRSDG